MKKTSVIFAFLLLLMAPTIALADLVKDGFAAWQAGDYAKAADSFRSGADKGDRLAQYGLASMMEKGQGMPKDEKRAAEMYLKSADQGLFAAQSNLGVLYAEGRGVGQDYQKAAYWYQRAANQGDQAAQRNLAVMYSKGLGVSQDLVQSWKWAELAARQKEESSARLRDFISKAMTADQLASARRAVAGFQPKSE